MDDERNRGQKPQAFLEGEELENAPVSEIGGKAFNLVRLRALQEKYDFVVPEFFVIPVSYWKSIFEKMNFEQRAEEIMASYGNVGDITRRDIIAENSVRWPEHRILDMYHYSIADKLGSALNKIDEFGQLDRWPHGSLYLRSSSPLEDSVTDSFAGVFASEIIPGNFDAETNLRSVVLSPWTVYAEHYLRRRGLAGKRSRILAVLVQKVPELKDYKYLGRIFFDQHGVEMDYTKSPGFPLGVESYKFNKAVLNEKLNLTSHSEIPSFFGPSTPFLSEKRIVELSELFSKIAEEFPEFAGGYDFEFVLGEEKTYIVQARKSTLGKKPMTYEAKDIDKSKILKTLKSHGLGFSPGNFTGVIVNLLNKYDKDFPKEKIAELDKQYPSAIFLTNLHVDPETRGGEFKKTFGEEEHVLSPNKVAVITCDPGPVFHEHFLDALKNDTCYLLFAATENLIDLPTGLKVGVISDGEEAVIYKV